MTVFINREVNAGIQMKRCVIIGGADIKNTERIRGYLSPEDYIIYCDSALRHVSALRAAPDLIVGDFDSYKKPESDTETIVLPREKDDTDTFYAAKEGIRRGFEDFLLLGAVGGRLDHTLGNVSILLFLDGRGKRARMADDYSEMEIVSSSRAPAAIDDYFSYFSLLNITGTARGITIKNAKYPLDGARIDCEYQYGISNEVIPGKTARVEIEEGKLLLIKVFPEVS